LLNGTDLPTGSGGRYSRYVWARAGVDGFSVWTVNVSWAGGMRESVLSLHGRWVSDTLGTAVVIWYAPRRWFVTIAMAPLALLVLLALLWSVQEPVYRATVGDGGGWVVAGAMLALAALLVMVIAELFSDTPGELLVKALHAERTAEKRAISRRAVRRRRRR